MCTAASLAKSTQCNIAGGIRRLLVMQIAILKDSDDVAPTFTLGTLADKFKIMAVVGAPPVYDIPFDRNRDAQASSTKNGNAFTHNVNVRITTNEHPILRDIDDLQNCCGYVAAVQDNFGAWFLLGTTINRFIAGVNIGELNVAQADHDTDTSPAGENVGITLAFSSERMNSNMIPISAAAVTTLLGLIVPAV